jgi:pimeloyl-ACP methyl ester carboxylesterase
MRVFVFALVLFCLILNMAHISYAENFYVACSSGNNSNSGISPGSPKRTIAAGMSLLRQGDTLYIKDNETCRLDTTLVTDIDGTSSSQITVDAYGGTDGVWEAKGSNLHTSWTQTSTNVWRSPSNMFVGRNVWQNGENRAVWYVPKNNCPGGLNSDKDYCSTDSFIYIYSTSNPSTRYRSPGIESLSQLGRKHLLDIDDNWWVFKNGIIQHAGNFVMKVYSPAHDLRFENMEFAWSPQSSGESLGLIQISVVELLTYGSDTLSNITFRGVKVHDSGRDGIDFTGLPEGSAPANGTISNISFEDFEIYNIFNHGAVGSRRNATVRNVVFRRGSFHAVCGGVGFSNTAVSNGIPQSTHIRNLIFEDVHFYDFVDRNDPRVYPVGENCGDRNTASGINGLVNATYNHVFRRVICEDSDACFVSDIPYSGSFNLTIENSVFINNGDAPFIIDSVDNLTVRNSIFKNNGVISGGIWRNATYFACQSNNCNLANLTTSTTNKNIFDTHGKNLINNNGTAYTLAQWKSVSGDDDNSIEANPNFVSVDLTHNSAPLADPNLRSNSPAIGFGTDGKNVGAFPSPPAASSCNVGSVNASTVTTAFSVAESPLSAVNNANVNVRVNGVSQSELRSSVRARTTTHTTLASPVSTNQDVRITLSYGFVSDSQRLGTYNGKNAAQNEIICTNTVSGSTNTVPGSTNTVSGRIPPGDVGVGIFNLVNFNGFSDIRRRLEEPVQTMIQAPVQDDTSVPLPYYQNIGSSGGRPCFYKVPDTYQYDCGYVFVPEQYGEDNGRAIPLSLWRFQSRSQAPGSPMILLVGGPGNSGVAYGQVISSLDFLLDSRDVILFDQRGAQAAVADADAYFSCTELKAARTQILTNGLHGDERQKRLNEAIQACYDRLLVTGVNFEAYNSLENAADINAIAQALGYDQFILYGESYGTLVAQHVMRDFPQLVEAVILDDSVGLEATSSWTQNRIVNYQVGFDHLVELCASHPACQAQYPNIQAQHDDLLVKVRAEPIETTAKLDGVDDTPVVIDDVTLSDALFAMLLENPVESKVFYYIQALVEHNASYPEALSRVAERAMQDVNATTAWMIHYAMTCLENPMYSVWPLFSQHGLSNAAVIAGVADAEDSIAACRMLDVPVLPDTARTMVQSDLPVLFLDGGFDNETSLHLNQALASTLPNSYTYVFPTGRHVQIAGEDMLGDCVNEIVGQFVNNPTAVPDGSCISTLPAPGFYIPSAQ